MILQTLQARRRRHLACPRDGKLAPRNGIPCWCLMLTVLASKAPAMGGRPTQVVLCATSDGKVAMGDPNRTGRLDAVYNADIHRDRPLASTPLATIHEQSSGVRVWEDRRAFRFGGGKCENFRRRLRSIVSVYTLKEWH